MREEYACRIRIRTVRCFLYIVTWVPDDGTYASERYLYTVLMSELPLCLTRCTSVTLEPLFQHSRVSLHSAMIRFHGWR